MGGTSIPYVLFLLNKVLSLFVEFSCVFFPFEFNPLFMLCWYLISLLKIGSVGGVEYALKVV